MASKQAVEAKEREQSQNLEMAGGEGACVASKQATKECEGSGPTHSPHRFYFSHGSSGRKAAVWLTQTSSPCHLP